MTLYFEESGVFSSQPVDVENWHEYEANLIKKVLLSKDLDWVERDFMNKIFVTGDFFPNFPAENITLVSAEVKTQNELQFIDLLYLREDGALLPAELKLGGNNFDTVGQLMRYISDLNYTDVSKSYVVDMRTKYLDKINDNVTRRMLKEKFEEFTSSIPENKYRALPKTGFLIDEDFRPQTMTCIRYLNDNCGLNIRLIKMDALVEMDWDKTYETYKMILKLGYLV